MEPKPSEIVSHLADGVFSSENDRHLLAQIPVGEAAGPCDDDPTGIHDAKAVYYPP